MLCCYLQYLMLAVAWPVILIESGSFLYCSQYIMMKVSWATGFAHAAYEDYYVR